MIIFYISSHGFGHLTRSIVHIERYLKGTEYNIYIVCGEKQIEFARNYLAKFSDRLIFNVMTTDVGLINKENSLEIDKLKLEKKLFRFIKLWAGLVEKEFEFLKNKNIEKIITDISPIGMLVGRKLGKKVEAISNFTWYNQYKFLDLKKEIVDKFMEAEKYIDEFSVYPLGLDLSHINCKKLDIEYVARNFNFKKIKKLKEKYREIIYISCGKSAKLEKIKVVNYNGTIFYTKGIEVEGEGYHIELPIEIEDSHNYVAASNFVISKAGWGTVAECMLSDVPMVLLERKEVLEDSFIIDELKRKKKAISLNLESLRILNIKSLKNLIKDISISGGN